MDFHLVDLKERVDSENNGCAVAVGEHSTTIILQWRNKRSLNI